MINEMEEVARSTILAAGDLIRDRIGTICSAHVETKGPADYVTDIDRQSETLIVDAIRQRFPEHHIMAEETSGKGLQPGITWVIDPLDGTTNFIHGFPFVAVSIAVCLDAQPVLGYVLDAVHQELFTAVKGGGAHLNGKRLRVKRTASLDEALVATGFPHRSRSLIDAYLGTFRGVFQKVSGIRRAGAAALDLAYLAAGRIDGFWEAGLKAWDIAAGSLLITEAGGTIDDFWGNGDYLHNGHVVAGTALVYPFLVDQVRAFLAPALESGGIQQKAQGEERE